MSLNDQNIKEMILSEFRGSDTTSDDYNLDPSHLNYAQNLDYTVAENGMVQASTRTGTTTVANYTAGHAITSLASWLFVTGGVQTGYAVFFDGLLTQIFAWNQNSSSFTSVLINGSVGSPISSSFVFEGTRMYAAFQTNVIGGPGANGGAVYGITPAAADNLFPFSYIAGGASITATATAGAASSGVVTAGSHRWGWIMTSRNGYVSVLNPVLGSGPQPNSWNPGLISGATGNTNYTIAITWNAGFFTNFPAFVGGTVQAIFTTASNLSRVFAVPGVTATIPSSSSTTNLVVSITDGDLAATGTDVTNNQNFAAQDPNTGAAPFKPSAIFQYSSRMGFCTYDTAGFPVVYFSDQNAYQSLTVAFHGVYIEGRQIPVQGTSLGGVCYIATLSGLYATQDNGGLPSTWIPPSRVDGSVGILSSSCMCASTQAQGTATGRIILAAEKGLFIFKGGTFPEIPLSYWQSPDWNRINWATPWQVQVVDDVYKQKIRVIAPLKTYVIGATNTNPIVITTATVQPNSTTNPLPGAHMIPAIGGTGLIQVTITGVGGNTNANGTFTPTVITATTFSIPVAGNGTFTSGGIVTPASQNAEMDWTYPVGDEPGQPFYSLNSWAAYAPNSIGIIKNITTEIDEVWYGPNGNSSPACTALQRRVVPTDALQYRDQDGGGTAAAINAILETSLVPGTTDTARTVHDYHGAHVRAVGSGTMSATAFSLDHSLSVVPASSPLTLSLTPGQELLMKWFLRSEQQSIQLSSNAVDNFFIVSRIKAYYTDSVPMR